MPVECYIPTDGEQSALILSPSLAQPGGWRVTQWDSVGPSGHTEHDTLSDARDRLRYESKWTEYRLANREPEWLGLTIITNGRVVQDARPERIAA